MMKIFFLSLAVILLPLMSFAQPGGVSGEWKLFFEDNFNGDTLDFSKWSYNYPWGTLHNHRANMQASQVKVKDGILSLVAKHERTIWDPWGKTDGTFGYLSYDYTSGAIHSKGKMEVTYGYIEGRFKMPSTLGTWPAFWTLNKTGEWPPEIDILEVNKERTMHHYYYHYGADWTQEKSFGGDSWGPDKSADFHTYGVEWTPDYMVYYFDGQVLNSYYKPTEIVQAKNMYIIINLAVGGWAGDPPADAVFPCSYQCDWVKVWKANGILNPGFERGSSLPWKTTNALITDAIVNSGKYSLRFDDNTATAEQTVEVESNTTYTISAFGRLAYAPGKLVMGVKDFGGTEISTSYTTGTFEQKSLTFSTGANQTTAKVYVKKTEGNTTAFIDDFTFTKLGPNAVDELSKKDRFKLYPSPKGNQWNIDIRDNLKAPSAKLVSMEGKVIRSYDLKNAIKDEPYALMVPEGLAPGIYLFTVYDSRKLLQSKKIFVK
ncbi:MAG: family 16 glycosylhydrolase [Bacteroidota bacterium]|nr:family 16 glycosylhydrolase [Bacteroidota bacterium]